MSKSNIKLNRKTKTELLKGVVTKDLEKSLEQIIFHESFKTLNKKNISKLTEIANSKEDKEYILRRCNEYIELQLSKPKSIPSAYLNYSISSQKKHASLSFKEKAKLISEEWKKLDEFEKKNYMPSENDMSLYKTKLNQFKDQTKLFLNNNK